MEKGKTAAAIAAALLAAWQCIAAEHMSEFCGFKEGERNTRAGKVWRTGAKRPFRSFRAIELEFAGSNDRLKHVTAKWKIPKTKTGEDVLRELRQCCAELERAGGVKFADEQISDDSGGKPFKNYRCEGTLAGQGQTGFAVAVAEPVKVVVEARYIDGLGAQSEKSAATIDVYWPQVAKIPMAPAKNVRRRGDRKSFVEKTFGVLFGSAFPQDEELAAENEGLAQTGGWGGELEDPKAAVCGLPTIKYIYDRMAGGGLSKVEISRRTDFDPSKRTPQLDKKMLAEFSAVRRNVQVWLGNARFKKQPATQEALGDNLTETWLFDDGSIEARLSLRADLGGFAGEKRWIYSITLELSPSGGNAAAAIIPAVRPFMPHTLPYSTFSRHLCAKGRGRQNRGT